jgi:hypothetical protein
MWLDGDGRRAVNRISTRHPPRRAGRVGAVSRRTSHPPSHKPHRTGHILVQSSYAFSDVARRAAPAEISILVPVSAAGSAIALTMACCMRRGVKLPEPIVLADRIGREELRAIRQEKEDAALTGTRIDISAGAARRATSETGNLTPLLMQQAIVSAMAEPRQIPWPGEIYAGVVDARGLSKGAVKTAYRSIALRCPSCLCPQKRSRGRLTAPTSGP